nr:immunoglobulin heavy chain junction region [Homo sapiens]
ILRRLSEGPIHHLQ